MGAQSGAGWHQARVGDECILPTNDGLRRKNLAAMSECDILLGNGSPACDLPEASAARIAREQTKHSTLALCTWRPWLSVQTDYGSVNRDKPA